MKAQLHGLRHGKIIAHTYLADTKSDPDWVLLTTNSGRAVARQAKFSVGKVFRQGTNPDYVGRESYPLERVDLSTGGWRSYDRQASKRDIISQLRRLVG